MTTNSALPWRTTRDGIAIKIRVTPRATRDSIDGLIETQDGQAFQAHLQAPPAEGRANVALEKLVAVWLDVAKCQVTLAAGHKSRLKTVVVSGDAEDLKDSLRALQRRLTDMKNT